MSRLAMLLLFASFEVLSAEHLSGINFQQFDQDGRLENSISAAQLVYIDDQLVISQPVIKQDNWQLSAESASVNTDFAVISFNKKVVIVDSKDPTLEITTEKLDYLVTEKLFTNEEYVTFKKNHLQMSGIGLRANLQDDQIRILRNVHTVLEVK